MSKMSNVKRMMVAGTMAAAIGMSLSGCKFLQDFFDDGEIYKMKWQHDGEGYTPRDAYNELAAKGLSDGSYMAWGSIGETPEQERRLTLSKSSTAGSNETMNGKADCLDGDVTVDYVYENAGVDSTTWKVSIGSMNYEWTKVSAGTVKPVSSIYTYKKAGTRTLKFAGNMDKEDTREVNMWDCNDKLVDIRIDFSVQVAYDPDADRFLQCWYEVKMRATPAGGRTDERFSETSDTVTKNLAAQYGSWRAYADPVSGFSAAFGNSLHDLKLLVFKKWNFGAHRHPQEDINVGILAENYGYSLLDQAPNLATFRDEAEKCHRNSLANLSGSSATGTGVCLPKKIDLKIKVD